MNRACFVIAVLSVAACSGGPDPRAAAPCTLVIEASQNAAAEVEIAIGGCESALPLVLERAAADGAFEVLGELESRATRVIDPSAEPRRAYRYRASTSVGGAAVVSSEARLLTEFCVGTRIPMAIEGESGVDLLWWDSCLGESRYVVERRVPPGAFAAIGTAPSDSTRYTDADAVPGVPFEYRLVAEDSSGARAPSQEAPITLPGTPPPAPEAPTALDCAIEGAGTRCRWTHAGADSYELERSLGTEAFAVVTSSIAGTAREWLDTEPVEARERRYRVRARSLVGSSPWSNEARATRPAPCEPPDLFVSLEYLFGTDPVVHLAWTSSCAAATAYAVEEATDAAGPFTQVALRTASQPPGGEYVERVRLPQRTLTYYRVRVVLPADPTPPVVSSPKPFCTGCWSGAACREGTTNDACRTGAPGSSCSTCAGGTTCRPSTSGDTMSCRVDTTPPPAPTGLSCALEAAGTRCRWTHSGAGSYELERSLGTSPFARVSSTIPGSAREWLDTGTLDSSPRRYRVRALSGVAASAWSNEALATGCVVPKPGTFLEPGASRITVTWSEPCPTATAWVVETAPSATGPFTEVAREAPNGSTHFVGVAPNGASGSKTFVRIGAISAAGVALHGEAVAVCLGCWSGSECRHGGENTACATGGLLNQVCESCVEGRSCVQSLSGQYSCGDWHP